jgi:hypothetical protein
MANPLISTIIGTSHFPDIQTLPKQLAGCKESELI